MLQIFRDILAHWPKIDQYYVMALMFILLISLSFLARCIVSLQKKKHGVKLPETHRSLAVHVFRRDSLWAKYCYKLYDSYPTTICNFVSRSLMVLSVAMLTLVMILDLGVLLLSGLSFAAIGLFYLILGLPYFLLTYMPWLIKFLLSGLGIAYKNSSFTLKLTLILAIIIGLVAFFRSTTWKVIRWRIDDYRDNKCSKIYFE